MKRVKGLASRVYLVARNKGLEGCGSFVRKGRPGGGELPLSAKGSSAVGAYPMAPVLRELSFPITSGS